MQLVFVLHHLNFEACFKDFFNFKGQEQGGLEAGRIQSQMSKCGCS